MPCRLADRALTRTLAEIAGVMAAATQPWWVIAGAACALHGLDGPVRDVDVLLAPADARRLLPPLGIALAPGASHPRFRSALFGRWVGPPLPVEFMADFAVGGANGWASVAPVTREAFAVGAAIVYAPARDELGRLLRLFGRPRDLARAARLG